MPSSHHLKWTLLLAGVVFFMAVHRASAQPLPNVVDTGARWEIQFRYDPSPTHPAWATQILCFLPYASVGTSIQGVWVSLSFPNWNGRYYQEGDEVTMTADYAQDVGHDGIHFEITSSNAGSGSWKEWREDGRFGRVIGWGNAQLTRVGQCAPRFTGLFTALRFSEKLPPRLLLKGEEAQDQVQRGQESPRTYFERNMQFVDSFFDIFSQTK